MHWWSCAQTIFHTWRGKIVWSTACSIFVLSATMVALQSDCFMRMTSRTAIDGDQRWLSSWSAMQETKPSRTRERPAKECQDFCEQAVYVSELENWQCEVPGLSNVDKIVSGLSEVDRCFMFCESLFLSVWKLWGGWSLQQAVSLECFRSFTLCVTSHNTFLKTLRHQILNRTEQNLNRQLTRLFFPSVCEN